MSQRGGVSTRALVVAGVLLALVLAGFVSYYASGSPDGLERVAHDHGFADSASEHHAAGGPFADYQTRGVHNDRISGGLAGIAGALVVLVLAGGLVLLVRRRSNAAPKEESSAGARSSEGTSPEQVG